MDSCAQRMTWSVTPERWGAREQSLARAGASQCGACVRARGLFPAAASVRDSLILLGWALSVLGVDLTSNSATHLRGGALLAQQSVALLAQQRVATWRA